MNKTAVNLLQHGLHACHIEVEPKEHSKLPAEIPGSITPSDDEQLDNRLNMQQSNRDIHQTPESPIPSRGNRSRPAGGGPSQSRFQSHGPSYSDPRAARHNPRLEITPAETSRYTRGAESPGARPSDFRGNGAPAPHISSRQMRGANGYLTDTSSYMAEPVNFKKTAHPLRSKYERDFEINRNTSRQEGRYDTYANFMRVPQYQYEPELFQNSPKRLDEREFYPFKYCPWPPPCEPKGYMYGERCVYCPCCQRTPGDYTRCLMKRPVFDHAPAIPNHDFCPPFDYASLKPKAPVPRDLTGKRPKTTLNDHQTENGNGASVEANGQLQKFDSTTTSHDHYLQRHQHTDPEKHKHDKAKYHDSSDLTDTSSEHTYASSQSSPPPPEHPTPPCKAKTTTSRYKHPEIASDEADEEPATPTPTPRHAPEVRKHRKSMSHPDKRRTRHKRPREPQTTTMTTTTNRAQSSDGRKKRKPVVDAPLKPLPPAKLNGRSGPVSPKERLQRRYREYRTRQSQMRGGAPEERKPIGFYDSHGRSWI
ncbi:hypothetical protein M426DRAFT_317608 [Hypoxylon sp. CI-4A]|nr:hypothetical protein M426DRAFT_317608 [Hypoxylon sp. CI-4A]